MDIFEAVEKNNIEKVKELLNQFKVNPDSISEYGWTLLGHASMFNSKECIRFLLNAGANVNLQDEDGLTALMKASVRGRTECVILLLQAGANVDIQVSVKFDLMDNLGWTVFMYAKHGHNVFGIKNCKKVIKILKRMTIVQILNNTK